MADKAPLSYSKSRWNTYERCQRQYWFNYIGYWNGWKLGFNPRTRQIYYNKNLRSFAEISGIIVHEIIANHFRSGLDSIDIDVEIEKMWKIYLDNTASKKWRNQKQTPAISELAFTFDMKMPAIAKWKNHTKISVENFYEWHQQLFKGKGYTVLSIDDNLGGFFELDIDGDKIRIYTIADLIVKAEKMYTVFDWKTGEENAYDDLQGMLYVMYVFDRYDVIPEEVNFRVVNVIKHEDNLYRYSLEECSKTLAKIVDDVRLFKRIAEQPEGSFEYTKTLDTCTRCHFKDLCPQGVKIC